MKIPFALAPTAALALFTLASCGEAQEAGQGHATLQSMLPSQQMNANQVAALYRQAKIAGAKKFQRPMRAADILTALENGVNGSGAHSESVFRISPINSADRDQVIALLEDMLEDEQ